MSAQIQGNIPSSFTSATDMGKSATYFNSVEAANIHPFYKREIIQPFGTNRLTSWIDMNSTPSTRPAMSFNHEEVGWMQEPLYASASVTFTAGAANTITLTSSSLAGGTKSPVAVGMAVLFKNDVFGVITAVPAENQITVTPSASQTFTVAANEAFIYAPASLVGEGSCAGASSLRFPPTNFNATMQFARLDEMITDEAYASFSSSVTFFDFAAGDGNSYPCWTHADLIDREIQFHNARELVTMTGMSFSNGALTGLGLRGTNGVLPIIRTYGNLQPYAANAGVQISDYEDVTIVMEKNHAPREYIGSAGIEFLIESTKAIKDYFPNGAVSYGAFGGSQANAIEWGFTSVGMNGRTFHLQSNEIFNHPSFLGAPGFNYTGSAVFMPASKTTDKGGNQVGYIETPRLQGQCSPVLGYQHYVVDGTGIIQTGYLRPTSCRRMNFTWWDTFGVEVFGARQLFLFQKA